MQDIDMEEPNEELKEDCLVRNIRYCDGELNNRKPLYSLRLLQMESTQFSRSSDRSIAIDTKQRNKRTANVAETPNLTAELRTTCQN